MRAAILLLAFGPAFGQLVSHPDAPVRIGHYHLNVTSIDEQKKFWVDTLGGKAIKGRRRQVVLATKFGNVRGPNGEFLGVRGDHVLIAPPFIIDGAAIDTIVERLGEAIDAATAQTQ